MTRPRIRAIGAPSDVALVETDLSGGEEAELTISLDPATPGTLVLPPSGRPEDAADSGGRIVATGNGRTWRRAPWPAGDGLFELPPAPDPAAVLVLGGDTERLEEVADAAAANGARPSPAPELTIDGLRGAATVVFVSAPGDPFPPKALAAAAAGRLVLMNHHRHAFGMAAGIDHFASDDDGALGRLAGDAARHPQAFDSLRAWARLAAERHRASVVFARLFADLRMGL